MMSLLRRESGALLPATLVALAALGLLASSAFNAAMLEQRMARHSALHQRLLVAADDALLVVEARLVSAVVAGDQSWLATSATLQQATLASNASTYQYQVSRCCETAWDPLLPAGADNVATLYHVVVQAQREATGSVALLSVLLITDQPAGPALSRRVGWQRTR